MRDDDARDIGRRQKLVGAGGQPEPDGRSDIAAADSGDLFRADGCDLPQSRYRGHQFITAQRGQGCALREILSAGNSAAGGQHHDGGKGLRRYCAGE